MQIKKNIDLKPFNTFQIEHKAKFFAVLENENDLPEILEFAKKNHLELLILGGGSNILLTKDFEGLVILNKILGLKIIQEDENEILISVGAGEIWHDLVLFCVENNWGGIENLALIPGTVGAAPMQNIGAYGVEIQSVFHSLEGFNLESNSTETYYKKYCDFNYRSSIFKTKLKNKFIITKVNFILRKKPKLSLEYGAIQDKLTEQNIINPSIKEVAKIVCSIRESKLPDPKKIGNAGSFFKNPIISKEHFEIIKTNYNDLKGYFINKNEIKISAAWLIEKCNWKGKIIGNTGTYKNHSLVLVNHGNAKGKEIWNLALEIQKSVESKFNILLTPEVNII